MSSGTVERARGTVVKQCKLRKMFSGGVSRRPVGKLNDVKYRVNTSIILSSGVRT